MKEAVSCSAPCQADKLNIQNNVPEMTMYIRGHFYAHIFLYIAQFKALL